MGIIYRDGRKSKCKIKCVGSERPGKGASDGRQLILAHIPAVQICRDPHGGESEIRGVRVDPSATGIHGGYFIAETGIY